MSRVMMHIKDLAIGHGKDRLYEGISFDIHSGDCIMLCGANGSGKTTLLKAIAGLNGTDGRPTLIPSGIPKIKGFSVIDFIKASCFRQTDMSGRLSPRDGRTMLESLETLGILHLEDRDISTLSDGEFQKACIASALVRHSGIILLDEPTAFLDAENKVSVLQTLKALCRRPDAPAVIFSTHDLHEGLKACNKVIALGADKVFRLAGSCNAEAVVRTIFTDNNLL